MLRHIAFLSLVLSTTLAQSSTPADNSTANPLIPTGITATCTQFLNELNTNSTLQTCTSSLLTATKQYAPGANATTFSSANVSTTLGSICSPNTETTCPDSFIRGKLVEFYSACPAELTSNPSAPVQNIYDALYALVPFRSAICSKDDNDNYCLLQKANSPSGLKSAFATDDTQQEILQHLVNDPTLQRRGAASTAAITPNMTTFRNANLLFLFIQPNETSAQLCTTCTRQIFMPYFNFETLVPYAPGLKASTMLGGQMPLFQAINDTCGPNFLQTNIQAAGGISGGTLFNGARQTADSSGAMIATALGLATLAIATLL